MQYIKYTGEIMRRKLAALIPLLVALALLSTATNTAHAQVSDVSDAVWSIVVPSASAINIDMGQVIVSEARDSVITGYLTNTGPVAIRIDDIFATGSDAGLFSLVSPIPPFVIEQGDTKAVEFRFAPTSVGIKNASIVVHTQIDTLTQSIQGEGVLPQVEVASELIDFGEVIVNNTKDTISVAVLRNTGSMTLAISGVSQLGPDEVQFSILSGDGGFTLAPGESKTMDLQFAPTLPSRTSGRLGFYYDGPGSPAIVNLYGDGKGVQGIAALGIDTIWAEAGDLVEIPVYLRNQENLAITGATGFYAELRFNSTLLSPFGTTPTGTVDNGEHTIILDNLPLLPDAEGALARLQFIASLGSAEGTPLHLENALALGGNVSVTQMPGYFFLSDVCREGGMRLFFETGNIALRQNRPNPFNANTVIDYEVIENGQTRLYVMDFLGRTVAVLVDGIVEAGSYSVLFDASALPSGSYLYVLQTPSERLLKLMEVAK
jgi:HYDIN/CFA65/VesB family protein